MKISGIHVVYYITACLSAALPSETQEDTDPTEAQSTSLAACMNKLEVGLSVDSIKDNVRGLDKYNKESLENFVAFLFDGMPYMIDIKQFRDGYYMGADLTTVQPRHKTGNDFFMEKLNYRITKINDMQSKMKTAIDEVTDVTLSIIGKACDAISGNLKQNTINPKYLFLHPLQRFSDSRSNDYDGLHAKVESNRKQLTSAILNEKEEVADPEYCSELGSLAEVLIKNYCKYHAFYKQMNECMEEFRSLLHSLEDGFETLVPEDRGCLSEYKVMKVCLSKKHGDMVFAIYTKFQDNQKCIKDMIHEYDIISIEVWKKMINLERKYNGMFCFYQ